MTGVQTCALPICGKGKAGEGAGTQQGAAVETDTIGIGHGFLSRYFAQFFLVQTDIKPTIEHALFNVMAEYGFVTP